MAAEGYLFDKAGAKRIVDVVRRVEGQRGPLPIPGPKRPPMGSALMAAVNEATDASGVYKGKLLYPSDASPIDVDAGISKSRLGTAAGPDIFLVYIPEISSDTHSLTEEEESVIRAVEPLGVSTDGKAVYRIIECGEGGGGASVTRMRVISTPTPDVVSCRPWLEGEQDSNPAEGDVEALASQGHAKDDSIYVAEVANGTSRENCTRIEVLTLKPSTNRYQVVQVIDNTGRLGLDWVRAR